METIEVNLCPICEKHPVRVDQKDWRHPSITCGAVCSNMLSACNTIEKARARYIRDHQSDIAFEKFLYPKDYVV